MASPQSIRTPYELRLDLVTDTVKSHSSLGGAAAGELAERILHALNSIPEKIR